MASQEIEFQRLAITAGLEADAPNFVSSAQWAVVRPQGHPENRQTQNQLANLVESKSIDGMKRILLLFLGLVSFAQVSLGQHLVFIIGEKEYETAQSLPAFFDSDLKPAGFTATFIIAPPEGEAKDDFPGLEDELAKADLCFVSVRRRAPKTAQLEALQAFVESGKPIVAIRTSSHAFHWHGKEPPAGHALWEAFDSEVLGGNYHAHYGEEPAVISVAAGAEEHPILAGTGDLDPTRKLYRTAPLAESATALLFATVEGKEPEPVAWTHTYGPHDARIFYTSLGRVEEFANPGFRGMLTNAIDWALDN